MPASPELLAFEFEIKMALGKALVRIALGNPSAAIPYQNRPAAVLA